jgi:hypothetical protein
MKPSIKFSLILIITLIIGIAIGFEISEISIKNRFERPENFRRPEGFLKIFGDIIKPEKDQKPVVDSILLKYHTRIEQHAQNSFMEISKQIDSMKIDLGKVLNKEQMARFEEEMNRMKRPHPPGDMPMRGGPPDDMRMRGAPPEDMRRGPGPDGMRRDQAPPDMRRDQPPTDMRKDQPEKKP